MKENFRRFATRASDIAAKPNTFITAVALILLWAALGPYYRWSTGHSLIVNTITTILTSCLSLILCFTSARNNAAMHAKLNAIILAIKEARNEVIDAETASDREFEDIQQLLADDKASGC
ncbi:hypothetical protein AVDCRST_MAG94-2112 [uncultured Leptolyngbya sp.]|uniref:Small integral membrane protein n=1 Tax=uncultured Leptolyngbya sp. TaxID=332963 RepID=A0A6J4LMQ3_9CYAN|nr:hypothetical protein AVDCRST_MAG94-2112 [uncultured Leptolyngbya sp.]